MTLKKDPPSRPASAYAKPAGKAILWLGALVSIAWVGYRVPKHLDPPTQTMATTPTEDSRVMLAVAVPSAMPPPCREAGHVEGGVLADGRVVLNRAGLADLMQLPGVGEKRARAIATLRERVGRFRSVRDLLRVKGLGVKLLRRIEPKLVLDAPSETPETERAASPEDVARKGA